MYGLNSFEEKTASGLYWLPYSKCEDLLASLCNNEDVKTVLLLADCGGASWCSGLQFILFLVSVLKSLNCLYVIITLY